MCEERFRDRVLTVFRLDTAHKQSVTQCQSYDDVALKVKRSDTERRSQHANRLRDTAALVPRTHECWYRSNCSGEPGPGDVGTWHRPPVLGACVLVAMQLAAMELPAMSGRQCWGGDSELALWAMELALQGMELGGSVTVVGVGAGNAGELAAMARGGDAAGGGEERS